MQPQPSASNFFPPGVTPRKSRVFISFYTIIDRYTAATQANNSPLTLDELDVIRHREIATKATSAIILLVLKWFKVSRMIPCHVKCSKIDVHPLDVMKFHHLGQLVRG